MVPAAGSGGGPDARFAASPGALENALGALVARAGQDVADAVIEALLPLLGAPGVPVVPALHDRQSLARELRCGVDTVDKLRREGMPEIRVGDAPRFELEHVLSWLRGRS